MQSILITGSSGGIGSMLVRKLLESGKIVYGIDKRTPIFDEIPANFHFYQGSITDFEFMNSLPWEQIDKVVHLAAISSLPECQINPIEAYNTNFLGTVAVAEMCKTKGIKALVNASTSAVYEGQDSYPFHEQMICNPYLVYPQSKLMAEQYLSAQKLTNGLPSLSLRFFNIIGPFQDFSRVSPPLINYLVREFSQKRKPILHSNGQQSRDYISIFDACNAIIAALDICHLPANVYSVCSGREYTVLELVKMVQNCVGSLIEPIYRSSQLLWDSYPTLRLGMYPLTNEIITSETVKKSIGISEKFHNATNWKILYPVEKHISEICTMTLEFINNA